MAGLSQGAITGVEGRCPNRVRSHQRNQHLRGNCPAEAPINREVVQDLEEQEDRARPQAFGPPIPPVDGVHEPAVQLRPILRKKVHVLAPRSSPPLKLARGALTLTAPV